MYFVEKTEDPNFLVVDVPSSILDLADLSLDNVQQEALSSFQKFNILAYKKQGENDPRFGQEQKRLSYILSSDKFNELISISDKKVSGKILYQGQENAVSEVIIYGVVSAQGLLVVRALGNNMDPQKIATLVPVLNRIDIQEDAFESLKNFF